MVPAGSILHYVGSHLKRVIFRKAKASVSLLLDILAAEHLVDFPYLEAKVPLAFCGQGDLRTTW